jgi:hypothetical protein
MSCAEQVVMDGCNKHVPSSNGGTLSDVTTILDRDLTITSSN